MTIKAIKITIVTIVTLAILNWMRTDRFDFDIRSIIPFTRGEVTLYDWGGLTLVVLCLWGYGRLYRDFEETAPQPDEYDYEEEEPEEDDQDSS